MSLAPHKPFTAPCSPASASHASIFALLHPSFIALPKVSPGYRQAGSGCGLSTCWRYLEEVWKNLLPSLAGQSWTRHTPEVRQRIVSEKALFSASHYLPFASIRAEPLPAVEHSTRGFGCQVHWKRMARL